VRVFKCHLSILISQSTFFRRYFMRRRRHSTTSTKLNGSRIAAKFEALDPRQMKIYDVDEKEMEIILRFIYVSDLPTFAEDEYQYNRSILNLTRAALQFELHQLIDYCITVLIFRCADDHDRIAQLNMIDGLRLEKPSTAENVQVAKLRSVCVEQLATYTYCFRNDNLTRTMKKNLQDEIGELVGHKPFYFKFAVIEDNAANDKL